jgi:hypothetical protein
LTNFTDVAMGIAYVYQGSATRVGSDTWTNFGTSYFSIALSLTALLTLMIVTRLIVHRRDVRRAMGDLGGDGGLYTAIVTMLMESYALYAVAFLLYIVPWAIHNRVMSIFSDTLGAIQVRAVFAFLRCAASL